MEHTTNSPKAPLSYLPEDEAAQKTHKKGNGADATINTATISEAGTPEEQIESLVGSLKELRQQLCEKSEKMLEDGTLPFLQSELDDLNSHYEELRKGVEYNKNQRVKNAEQLSEIEIKSIKLEEEERRRLLKSRLLTDLNDWKEELTTESPPPAVWVSVVSLPPLLHPSPALPRPLPALHDRHLIEAEAKRLCIRGDDVKKNDQESNTAKEKQN